LLQLQQKAFSGIIQPYNPNVLMLGAENRNNVTCYLDALLFAMFAKLTAFECMLKNDSADPSDRKLATLLRLWVNMLRSGKLIHTDLVCTPYTGNCLLSEPESNICDRRNTYKNHWLNVDGLMPKCSSNRIRQKRLDS
jgi:hypothetical protein